MNVRCSAVLPVNGKREQALIHSTLLRKPLQFSAKAIRTSPRSSARHPGKSANSAGVQRAFGSVVGVAGDAGCSVVTGTAAGVADAAGAGTGRTVPQAASVNATKISAHSEAVMRETQGMIESGLWIFLVEALVAGCLFASLIWWVVRGTGDRDRKLREFDEKARKDAEAAAGNIDKN